MSIPRPFAVTLAKSSRPTRYRFVPQVIVVPSEVEVLDELLSVRKIDALSVLHGMLRTQFALPARVLQYKGPDAKKP